MSNPNFVNDLVMMAKAFEELPIVTAQRDELGALLETERDTVRDREATILKLKQELDAAHAATRKAEVERDEAEKMFLETDDKLNALRRLVTGFQGEVSALVKASEPEVKPEPPAEVKVGASEAATDSLPPQEVNQAASTEHRDDFGALLAQPMPTVEVNQVPVDPTTAPTPTSDANPIGTEAGSTDAPTVASELTSAPEVAAQPDPIATAMTGGSETAPILSAETKADASTTNASGDSVGYHNEPDISTDEWLVWYNAMNAHYGDRHSWPDRDYTITHAVNSQT